MKIIVDMLGGDLGLEATIAGVSLFLKSHQDVKLVLVGPKDKLSSFTNQEIIDASKSMKMDAHAMEILHDNESSMARAINALKEDGDAIVSCGGTGALLTLASLRIKKIDGVIRPALISPIPTSKENAHTVMLDLGANNSNSSDELISFIQMAKLYYQALYNKDANFALLSNGTEEEKGSPLIQETYKKIKELNIPNFKGNIEATSILTGDTDIIVTDGYTGNVALKSIEGVGAILKASLKKVFLKSIKSKLAYLFIHKDLKKTLNMFSSKPLGGAMFIGIKKVVIKAHGNSDAVAFKNALETAYKSVNGDLINKISQGIK